MLFYVTESKDTSGNKTYMYKDSLQHQSQTEEPSVWPQWPPHDWSAALWTEYLRTQERNYILSWGGGTRFYIIITTFTFLTRMKCEWFTGAHHLHNLLKNFSYTNQFWVFFLVKHPNFIHKYVIYYLITVDNRSRISCNKFHVDKNSAYHVSD